MMTFADRDPFRHDLIAGAELVGQYGFPKLRPAQFIPRNLIPFNQAMTERRPDEKWVHFFVDDYQFERIWNTPGTTYAIRNQVTGNTKQVVVYNKQKA